jgi:hypothetical protein
MSPKRNYSVKCPSADPGNIADSPQNGPLKGALNGTGVPLISMPLLKPLGPATEALVVIPTEAGIQVDDVTKLADWTPAFAGATSLAISALIRAVCLRAISLV